jgi:hypothetical protein
MSSARRSWLPHDTVGSLAQLLGHIVLLAHDKVLVENLEDLATLYPSRYLSLFSVLSFFYFIPFSLSSLKDSRFSSTFAFVGKAKVEEKRESFREEREKGIK